MAVEAEAFEPAGAELGEQGASRRFAVERPRVDIGQQDARLGDRRGERRAGRRHDFARLEQRQLVGQRLRAIRAAVFGGREFAGGQVEQRDADDIALAICGRDSHQKCRFAGVEKIRVGQRAGRDDAHDLALDESLGLLRIFDLIADGDAKAFLHEPCDVGVDGVMGDTAHRNAAAVGVFRARGQCEIEGARRDERVLVEHLVEIPHAEEHDCVAMLIFGIQVLPHRRGRRR